MVASDAVLATLSLFAAGMAAATAYLLRWAGEARTPLRASTVVFLLLMMVAMLVGAAVYYVRPSSSSLVEGFWVASALMSVSVIEVFFGFLEEVRRRTDAPRPDGPPRRGRPRLFAATVLTLVLANEFLMGWTFQAAAGLPIGFGAGNLAGVLSGLASVVNSPWFLFTMSAEMLLTAVLLRHRLPRAVLVVLIGQSVIMLLSPPALAVAVWVDLSTYAASAVMIGLFVFLMEYLYRTREVGRAFGRYLLRLLGVYGLMMAGLYLWWVYGDPLAFAASVVVEMVLYFDLIVRPEEVERPDRFAWALRPGWTTGILAGIFVAELFMGALLNVAVAGSLYGAGFAPLALSGPGSRMIYAAIYNGFWFFASTTASTWFLLMMGVEMGTLVLFKFRETRSRETRVRLGLMMAAYGAFAVWFPSVSYAELFPRAPAGTSVPVLGWPMGIGSAPIATGVFGAILATYAVLGVLTFLFGRRVVCSTFCTAPLMFQGTTVDAMKSFNRSSPLARKFLSSRFSRTFSTVTGVVLVSLVLAALASALDASGRLGLVVLGADPTVFLFACYFSILWYVLFVTIPYFGTYNCVTTGWCYTGTISGAFSRLGLFRLKVRDREVCRRCTTVDCARSCPVGLVDMPGHFRSKGEFRSSKCCGVGDCVEACPYDNMYFYDARHWFREKLGVPEPPRPARLPMVRASPATPPVPVPRAKAAPSGASSPTPAGP